MNITCDCNWVNKSDHDIYFRCRNEAIHFYVQKLPEGNEYRCRCEEHRVYFIPPDAKYISFDEYLALKAVDYVHNI